MQLDLLGASWVLRTAIASLRTLGEPNTFELPLTVVSWMVAKLTSVACGALAAVMECAWPALGVEGGARILEATVRT